MSDDWQTLSTAPTDGTVVLVWLPKQEVPAFASYCKREQPPATKRGIWPFRQVVQSGEAEGGEWRIVSFFHRMNCWAIDGNCGPLPPSYRWRDIPEPQP